MTGSLAPPPPYGSEQGSILLEAGRDGQQSEGGGATGGYSFVSSHHGRSRSGNFRIAPLPQSPGPVRSPTEISLAQLAHIPSHEDIGEGTSRSVAGREGQGPESPVHIAELVPPQLQHQLGQEEQNYGAGPPPEYTSPEGSVGRRRGSGESGRDEDGEEGRALLGGGGRGGDEEEEAGPQVPSYDVAVGNEPDPHGHRDFGGGGGRRGRVRGRERDRER